MTIWLISDTHFGHANMLKFVGWNGEVVRPGFKSAEEMDEAMVERWNATVRPQDHVYHLGDVAMAKPNLVIVKRLNGRKRLVLGNHDGFDLKAYKQVGFQKIFGSRKLDNLLLTHIPVHPISIPRWALGNVHGHIHERPAYGPEYLNVSVEQVNYTPLSLEDAKAALRRQLQTALEEGNHVRLETSA